MGLLDQILGGGAGGLGGLGKILGRGGSARDQVVQVLPRLVDHLTPQGEMSGLVHVPSSADDFMRRMNFQSD